jgi:uncharacterized membrane protein
MNKPDMTSLVLGSFDGTSWSWHLKRNISISPTQMALIFTVLGLISLAIGAGFYMLGASLVLPFSLLEIAVLLIAYFYNAVHANDYEKLVLSEKNVAIETKIGFKTSHVQFSRSLTRIDRDLQKNALITFKHGNQSTLFGQFVHANLRPTLAKEISKRMLPELQ